MEISTFVACDRHIWSRESRCVCVPADKVTVGSHHYSGTARGVEVTFPL